ncbi:golgin subfamily A member 3 [Puma concolor]|uniref:Golgin subfamily A member 3 n=1 Tax=Puma concolor TaxID=9696 RepID=A0A6P6HG19_PUMCO|nr:golgin subfamily A member 3 [Puma concolor]
MVDVEGPSGICLVVKGKGPPRQRDQLLPEQHPPVIVALAGTIAPAPTGKDIAKSSGLLLMAETEPARSPLAAPEYRSSLCRPDHGQSAGRIQQWHPSSPRGPPRAPRVTGASVEAHRAADGGRGLDGPGKGDTCQNGPTPLFPDPASPLGPATSPLGPEASAGVADFHDNLRKSQGTGAEGSVRKEALQSLRLSLPMQETQLCSTEASLPLEKEEQVRLQARRRLEEQLKQYRVKRQQERCSQPAARARLSSTLDPELMLNPEALPRANPVALTKEYSFLRTSVPRGPKVGSLGLLAHPKGKRSSKPSKIRSLADYKTEDSSAGSCGGNAPAADAAGGALKQSRSSVTSVVSEVSPCPEAEDHLENASLTGDNTSEADGNESDSSSLSSVSTRGTRGLLVDPVGTRDASYVVNGQEIAAAALGQFPSITDVLQAAAAEHQDQGREVNGETRSRTDSICSSVSLESSAAETHDAVLQALKDKMRLEGQLEALSLEASQALKEKAELQAQLAALSTRLQAQVEQSHSSQQKQDSLSSEVDTLKQSCWDLERAMTDLQNMLEAKNASLASSNSDLQLAEEQYQRLVAKVEEMQRSILSKDNTVHDLRQQMTGLQSQLQQVQLERTTLSSKLKASQAEIASLQHVRQWYQQQLALAQEARVRLQGEMAHIQVGQMTQAGLLEHLKLENVSLSHQLTETQHRSIKEKERIAIQLQGIEADMLDQEAAFAQIQEAKTMVEEDLQRRLEEFEGEKEQLQKVAAAAASLEQQLEQMKLALQQRDQQLEALRQEHLDLLKQLTCAQEELQARERTLGDVQVRYDELQARLEELQEEAASRDDAIRSLQNEKIVLEVALQAARSSGEGLDRGAQRLAEGAEETSQVLEQLRQELAVKSSQVGHLQQEAATLRKQTQKVKEQFLQQKVMVEAYRRDATSKDQLIGELKATKKRLDSELKELRQELIKVQGEKKSVDVEHVRLQKEVSQVRQQMADLEGHLQAVQRERDEMETHLQSLQFDKEQMVALTEANEVLKKQIEELQQEATNSSTFSRYSSNSWLVSEMISWSSFSSIVLLLSETGEKALRSGAILTGPSAARSSSRLKVQAVLQRKEEEDRQTKQLVHALEAALEQEKAKVHSLKEQNVFAMCTWVQGIQEGKHSQEIGLFQAELAEARTQLQLLQKQLDEQLNRQPAGNQEMENLKWEVDQKEREIQSLKQQLDLTEQQSKKELDGIQHLLQNIKAELETVREDLSLTQKDKFMLQAKVSELKNNMKTLLQQNQQLRLDLRRGAAKTRKELKGEAGSSGPVTPVKIPDCPVPASLLEELLRPPPAVSKEPLKNLNSCLQQLKQEMDSLQRQMEAHTVTVHESLSSWTQGDPSASPAPLGDHANPRGDTEQLGQCKVSREELGTAAAERPQSECL